MYEDPRWQSLVDQVQINNQKFEASMNKPIMARLDSIYVEDQRDRMNMDRVREQYGWQSRQMDSLMRKMFRRDSINVVQVKQINDTHGWQGPDQVGRQGASTIFLVIQHADSLTQVRYISLLKKAVKKGNARPQDLALIEDRILTRQDKPQIYGSQL